MNYFFGDILIPIETFLKNNLNLIGMKNIDTSNLKYSYDDIYLKLILNFTGFKVFNNNIRIFYNDKKFTDRRTYFVYIHGYPYVWHYIPSLSEYNMKSNSAFDTYVDNKFQKIYEQSKKFKKKYKKLKKKNKNRRSKGRSY